MTSSEHEATFSLRYVTNGDNNYLDARDLAAVAEGLSELDELMNGSGGDTRSHLVVRPPREGSFLLEIVIAAAAEHAADATVGMILTSLFGILRKMGTDRLVDVQELPNDRMQLRFESGATEFVSRSIYDAYMDQGKRTKTHRALMKLLKPLRAPHVDELVADYGSSSNPAGGVRSVRFTNEHLEDLEAAEVEVATEKTLRQNVRATVVRTSFDKKEAWKFKEAGETVRSAIVLDEDFLNRYAAKRIQIGRDDELELTVVEEKRYGDRTTYKWEVVTARLVPREGGGGDEQSGS